MENLGNAGIVLHFPAEQKPLENDLILARLFSFCPVETLKACRLVCKLWSVTSLDTWRATAVLRVFYDEQTQSFDNRGITLSRLWYYVDPARLNREGSLLQLHMRPFRNFELVHWSFSPGGFNTQVQLDFWRLCGPKMEHLTIHNSFVQYDDVLWRFLNTLPNLTSLRILDSQIDALRAGQSPHRGYGATAEQIQRNKGLLGDMIQLLRIKVLKITSQESCGHICRILKRFPNLEELYLSERRQVRPYGRTRRWIIPARNLFRTIHVETDRGENRFRALKKFDIIDFWEDAVRDFHINVNYEEFRRFKFSLTHLFLDIGENTTHTAIKITLGKNVNTLQVLKIFRSPTYGPYIHSFPFGVHLPHLREMYLWGYIVHNFGFLLYMPSLKILKIELACHSMDYKVAYLLRKRFFYMWNEDMVANTVDMLKHQEMEREPFSPSLETLYVDIQFPPESLVQLRRWLPNLKRLSTILNENTVVLTAKLWPQLWHLEMLFGSDVRNEDLMVHTFGILFHLESFKMDMYCCRSVLSDLTAYEGLLPLPYLGWVDICVSKEFTKRAEKDMKEKLGVNRAKIVRNYGQHRERCCIRAEFNCKCIPLDPPKEEPKMTRSGKILNPDRI